MWSLRERARACLTDGASLFTDRGGSLFVTNAPSCAGALEAAGFETRPCGALLAIRASAALLDDILDSLPAPDPADELTGHLVRLKGRPVCAAEMDLINALFKCAEPGGGNRAGFEKKLRELTAVCLRTGAGGALYIARGMLLSII